MRTRTRFIVAILAVLIFLIAACAPKPVLAPAPQALPQPVPAVQPAPVPEMQPAPDQVPVTPQPAVELKTTGQAEIAKLTPAQQKLLNDRIAIAKQRAERMDQKIALLAAYAEKRNIPELTTRVETLKQLYKGNTILVLLDRIDAAIDTADENLDEDSVRLREELDALAVLSEELKELAQQQNDPELTALANDLDQVVDEAQHAYDEEYLDAFEEATGTDLEENDYYETVEEQYDQEIEQEYDVAVEALEYEEAEQEAEEPPEDESQE